MQMEYIKGVKLPQFVDMCKLAESSSVSKTHKPCAR